MTTEWRSDSRTEFVDYFSDKSRSSETLERVRAVYQTVIRFTKSSQSALDVVDIGCGAGAHSLFWAGLGHRVHGLDVNGQLIALARERMRESNQAVDFRVGSATNIPWAANSMDLCLAPELLEHVPDWRACLDEFARVLRPGGLLLMSTTNALCPRQQEFSLPLYSWYPRPIKRRIERLAATTRPELAGHATYPAVNWFTFYGLRRELSARGFSACFDRFDMIDLAQKSGPATALVRSIRAVATLRWLAHICTPYTMIMARKA
jgi:2-polyprenyl-6-hydroxyphenyl methylase/3-demethylubiquinone-9 3-methyltransferase